MRRFGVILIGIWMVVSYGYAHGQESQTLRAVEIGRKWGFLNEEGQIVIQPQFDAVGTFSEGLAIVIVGGTPDRKYELVRGGKWGYIDKTGKYVISPRFDYIMEFHEELAAVKIGKKWGCVGKTGKVVIHPQFDDARNFSAGLAEVRIGERRYVRFSDIGKEEKKEKTSKDEVD